MPYAQPSGRAFFMYLQPSENAKSFGVIQGTAYRKEFMKLKATGQLRHHFFGDYSAGICLAFETADAALALPKVTVKGVEWCQSENKRVLVTCVDSQHLEVLKVRLAEMGANPSAIDSMDHSIDFGDPFNIEVDVEDPRQLALV